MIVDEPSDLNVSRGTFDRLQQYVELLKKWTPRINLISKSSVPFVWQRHVADAIQLTKLELKGDKWLDLGSGGGFPGLVVAICAIEDAPNRHVTLVESDQRKCAFLRTVVRELKLNAAVANERVEKLPLQTADVVSARALADLSTLLSFAVPHLKSSGHAVFMKGNTWEKEVQNARSAWSFDLDARKSVTDNAAAILLIKGIKRA